MTSMDGTVHLRFRRNEQLYQRILGFFNLSLALMISNDVHGEVFHSCQKHVIKTTCSNSNCSRMLALRRGKVLEKLMADLTHLRDSACKGLTQQHITMVLLVITNINGASEMVLILA